MHFQQLVLITTVLSLSFSLSVFSDTDTDTGTGTGTGAETKSKPTPNPKTKKCKDVKFTKLEQELLKRDEIRIKRIRDTVAKTPHITPENLNLLMKSFEDKCPEERLELIRSGMKPESQFVPFQDIK
ncbi:MAG: hypothetical protein ISR65_01340 [Bacteriovoracaceae bacterium]|nr:hypothetical protein [Bacteriovoracaceae bacterium]